MTEKQKPLEILVIDDAADFSSLFSIVGTSVGVNVTEAVNGEEGISKYSGRYEEGNPYHAVITDFNMPGQDGLEVTQRIKEQNPEAIVYLHSTYPDPVNRKIDDNEIPENLRPDTVMQKTGNIDQIKALFDEIRLKVYDPPDNTSNSQS